MQYLLDDVVKETFGLWEVPIGMRVDLKCVTTMPGTLFVMITLDLVMLELLVDNLDSLMEVMNNHIIMWIIYLLIDDFLALNIF